MNVSTKEVFPYQRIQLAVRRISRVRAGPRVSGSAEAACCAGARALAWSTATATLPAIAKGRHCRRRVAACVRWCDGRTVSWIIRCLGEGGSRGGIQFDRFPVLFFADLPCGVL